MRCSVRMAMASEMLVADVTVSTSPPFVDRMRWMSMAADLPPVPLPGPQVRALRRRGARVGLDRHDIEAEADGDGDLPGVEGEVGERPRQPVGGGEMEGVDGPERLRAT